jgi:hypothetical protein
MSTTPRTVPPPGPFGPKTPSSARFVRWNQRILGICFAVFSLEVGLFLLVFPWLNSWNLNWVPLQSPVFRSIWLSAYFRGALSGLGLVNLYIGTIEFLRQFRALARRVQS